jgi:hypothetical protein
VSLGRYALVVAAILAVSLGTLLLLPSARLVPAARSAGIFGALLAAGNTLLAYALAAWSQERSTRAFFGAVVGGMAMRMGLMLGAVLAAVLALGLPSVPLTVSLLAHFTLFLVLELTFLHRRTTGRRGEPGLGGTT